MAQPVIARSSDVMGGTVVFYGTRVPVPTLLDYLEGGETINDFLEGFPSVTREQVIAFLGEAVEMVSIAPVGVATGRCGGNLNAQRMRFVNVALSSSQLERGNARPMARAHPTPDTPNRVWSSIFTSGILSSTGCSPCPVCSKVRTGPAIIK